MNAHTDTASPPAAATRMAAITRMTGAEALVRGLQALGTELVFGYPGGAIMPVYDALHAHASGLRHVLARHEQGAVHAAQGYARSSGRVGVCLATSGPGATNLITGLADALMDSTPLVCITGQVPSAMRGTDAFQEADVIGMTLACTKWNVQVTDAADIPAALRTAFRVARSGRPGPVLVDITKDAQFATLAVAQPATEPGSAARWHGPAPHEDLSGLQAAAELINAAERPLLLVGQGVLLSGAEREVLALAERAGVPLAATLLGLSAVPTDHPLYVGMLGMHGNYAPNLLTNEADVIVAVGMRFDDRVTGRLDAYARQARIVHIEIDPAEIDKCVPATVALVSDARQALRRLTPLLEHASHPDWLARFHALEREETAAVIAPQLCPPDAALRMGEVVHRLSEHTDGAAIVVSDVGQHQMFAARHYGFRRPGSHITSGGLGTMGFALPAAIGAQLGAPRRTVLAVIGDGGFQMTVQELGTLMQEQIPVKVVVLNNGYLGMVRQWQELFFERRYSQVRMQNPDFVALVGAYGIAAERVSERDALDGAIRRLLTVDGPAFLEVAVAAEDNVFPMIQAGAAVDEMRLR